MTERAALVTGGSSGIGLEIARVLVRRGFAVTIGGRRREKLEAAEASLATGGVAIASVAGDISDPKVVTELVERHRKAHGRLDVLVNNAGLGIGRPIEAIRDRDVELQFGVNVRSVILMYREAVPLLREAAAEHRNALVINNASIGGKRPEPLISVYSAMKAGVVALTAAMNRELGPEGIKSTALCPGFVDTELTAWTRDTVPQEEMLSVDDVASAVDWLLSTSPNCVVPELELTRPGDRM
ncbi:MAG: SDR family oxidoreductase [Actinobacteria bacterium]|nr:SDR family oxidoreductase [Actinomycetota bacterium]